MMASRQTLFRSRAIINNLRQFSSSSKYLEVIVNDDNGIATVTMNRPPVNSLNLEYLSEISNLITDLKKNKSRGMILTSSSGKVFSAGLDIMEMYKPDSERFKQFWFNLQEVWMNLYSSPFPTAAAINGHSPAGGCLLATCCEYRVMVNNFTIGLNETQLGIVAPIWFMRTFINTIGHRNAELALTAGKLFKTDEALSVGLIDEVATDKSDALKKAVAFFDRFEMIHPLARSVTKDMVRGSIIESCDKVFSGGLNIQELCNPDSERFRRFWFYLQEVWINLYSSPYPTAAAINGHSPAGGCLLATCCEYRVMVQNFTIGLNETHLGVSAPIWFLKTFINTIGFRNAELALTAGRLFKTDEALKIGLIDEAATDKADALKKAASFFERFQTIPPFARDITKNKIRESIIEDLKKNREKDIQDTLSIITQPKIQQSLEFYLALLKSKKRSLLNRTQYQIGYKKDE